MENKVRVYSKAQNRTALGIMHAYHIIYPYAKIENFRHAFPNSISPDKGVKENFLPVEEALEFNTNMSLYFTGDNDLIELVDGTKMAVEQVWTKSSLDNLAAKALEYGIEIASDVPDDIKRGTFRLEYINGFNPNPNTDRKKSKHGLIWILLAVIVIIAVVLGLLLCL